jgi:hypothetical protein
MKTVWKYQLEVKDRQSIAIPSDYKFLSVQTQDDIPCVWVLVDPASHLLTVDIITHGTGHPCPDLEGTEYIGTYQLGSFVGHVWGIV